VPATSPPATSPCGHRLPAGEPGRPRQGQGRAGGDHEEHSAGAEGAHAQGLWEDGVPLQGTERASELPSLQQPTLVLE
jgi:hypothetical protein